MTTSIPVVNSNRLWALEAPTLVTESGDLVRGLSGQITIPCPAFLIQHAHGLVMFDTTWAPAAFDDSVAEYGRGLVEQISLAMSPEQRIDRQLQALGFSVDDVTHVVVSHGHADHTGGIRLFPNARLYIGPEELDRFTNAPADVAFLYRAADIEGIDPSRWTVVGPEGHDIFGDGTLRIVAGPGHSPGEIMLLVELSSESILLTGDAVHLQEGLDLMSPDGHSWDDEASLDTLRAIRQIADDGVRIWIGHDPRHWAERKRTPDFYA